MIRRSIFKSLGSLLRPSLQATYEQILQTEYGLPVDNYSNYETDLSDVPPIESKVTT